MNGKIRLGSGKQVWYRHAGFFRNYEEEYVLTLEKGEIIKKEFFLNCKQDDFTIEVITKKIKTELQSRIPWEDFQEF